MSVVVTGTLLIAVLLVTSMVTLGSLVGLGNDQTAAMRDASRLLGARARTRIQIISTTTTTAGGATTVQAQIANPGAESVPDFADMDAIVKYTNSTDGLEVKRLAYVAGGNPGNDQWSVSSITPDVLNTGMWDPDEDVVLTLKMAPPLKTATSGVLTVSTHNGVTDSTTFTE